LDSIIASAAENQSWEHPERQKERNNPAEHRQLRKGVDQEGEIGLAKVAMDFHQRLVRSIIGSDGT
jgi:hypothetical protein